MPKWLLGLLTVIVGAIIKRASPIIQEELHKMIDILEKKAKETPNTIDDLLVDLLKDIFGYND